RIRRKINHKKMPSVPENSLVSTVAIRTKRPRRPVFQRSARALPVILERYFFSKRSDDNVIQYFQPKFSEWKRHSEKIYLCRRRRFHGIILDGSSSGYHKIRHTIRSSLCKRGYMC